MATTTRTTRARTTRKGDTSPAEAGDAGAQPTQAQTAAPAVTAGPVSLEGRSELLHLNPRTLIIEGNIRSKAELDPEFVESVRELGVLEPIVAVQTERGVQVRFGQRRTLAAIEALRPTVPVLVVTGEPGAELDRIIEQWHENEHRTGLSVSDQARAAQQLAAFGLSAEDISARLGAAKPRVAQALQVGQSELATKAADRYELTLEQAAVLAEFEDDKESLTLLIAAVKEGPGRFAHAVQVVRDARELAAKIAEATAKLEKAKVRIIARDQARGAVPLNDLTASQDRTPITPAQHKKCPGNAAYIAEGWRGAVETVHVCTDWRAHGHHSRWGTWQDKPVPAQMSEEEAEALTEQERERRRTVIANNKAWASAEKVRQAWLKTFLTRKTLPKGAAGYLAAELAHGDYILLKALENHRTLGELLGYKGSLEVAAATEKASDGRAQVIALAVILAAMESSVTREAWRTPQPATKRYFQFLVSVGYEPSDVEQLVLGPRKPPRKKARPAAQPKPAADDQVADDQNQPTIAQDAAGAQDATDAEAAA